MEGSGLCELRPAPTRVPVHRAPRNGIIRTSGHTNETSSLRQSEEQCACARLQAARAGVLADLRISCTFIPQGCDIPFHRLPSCILAPSSPEFCQMLDLSPGGLVCAVFIFGSSATHMYLWRHLHDIWVSSLGSIFSIIPFIVWQCGRNQPQCEYRYALALAIPGVFGLSVNVGIQSSQTFHKTKTP